MKTIRVVLTAVIMAAFNVAGSAQSHDHAKASDAQDSIKTESFKVWGECGMCKSRIEKTVMAEGATDASWDSKTKLLTVRYNPAKTGKEALCKSLLLPDMIRRNSLRLTISTTVFRAAAIMKGRSNV
jgi:hypothetical protein